ncbi:MAG: asparagine synthase (glutamine-hydrolyzing) [Phycisphaerales bacterium]
MCGICGIIRRDGIGEREHALLQKIAEYQRHRGPDGDGFFENGLVSLGMRRLAIIDREGGWQPLYNEDKSVVVVANGEIYNFVEVRRWLEERGHRFRTGSDCESIPHLYEELGLDFVSRLRGMFACAVWDVKRRRLVVARDRLGEKPLYVAETPGQVILSSELRPLVRSGAVRCELDADAIVDYFHYGFVPDPGSPIKGVRKLSAGCMLIVDVEPWSVREHRYWKLDEAPPVEGVPARLLRDELERIIEMTVVAEVPVGVCLSAGVDSTAVAALAAQRYKGTIHAVSVGFANRAWQDESADAARTAERLKIPFHRVEVTAQDAAASFAEVAIARDQPFVDLSGISLFHLMRQCRELGLVVMLSGQGGDELFFGYSKHREAIEANRRKAAGLRGWSAWRRYLRVTSPPRSLTRGVEWMKSLAGLRSGWKQMLEDRRLPSNQLRFWDLNAEFRDARSRLPGVSGPLIEASSKSSAPYRHAQQTLGTDAFDIEIMRLFIDVYLRENGLAQGDRISMWHGVELRNPLVDYRLAELAVGLRKTQGASMQVPKGWLREAVGDLVPEWVLSRPKKGFSSPWRSWINAIAAMHASKLRDGALVKAGVLSPAGADYLASRAAPGSTGMPDHVAICAMWLEVWLRGFES